MSKAERQAAVEEITESFRGSNAALLTEYRGLTVKQLKELRRSLGADTQYAVVKNTLTKRAATEAGIAGLGELLAGPSAIAFIKGDPVEAAKGLRDFAKANPLLVIKGGIMDGKALSAAEIAKIADLESREVLLAKLAGAMKALPTRAAGLFQAPLSQMARLAKALEATKTADDAAPTEVVAEAPAAEVVAEAPAETETVEAPEAAEAPEAVEAPEAEAAAEVVEASTEENTEAPAEPAE